MSYGFRGPRQPYGGYGRPSAPIVHRPPMQRPPNMSRPRAPMGNRPWGHAFANLHNNQDEQFEKEVPMHLVTIDHVKEWLTRQHPMVIREVNFHSRWLLEKMGYSVDGDGPNQPPNQQGNFADDEVSGDMGGWYASTELPGRSHGNDPKRGKKRQGLGYQGATFGKSARGQQWTPDGWTHKDNSHKITTVAMRPLPQISIVPPMSSTYPDASEDNHKLRNLENNVGMMTTELNSICRRFNISELNRDDLSGYPEDQREKLQTAVTCVNNAEKTLSNFKEFLKTDKYKEWNDAQEKQRSEEVKQMIGETPDGVPYKRPNEGEAGGEEEEQEQEEKESAD